MIAVSETKLEVSDYKGDNIDGDDDDEDDDDDNDDKDNNKDVADKKLKTNANLLHCRLPIE